MRKQRIEYQSPIDAIVALAKQLCAYEEKYRMASENFYDNFQMESLEESIDFIEWANR